MPTPQTKPAPMRTKKPRTPTVQERALAILKELRNTYPNARCELNFENPWQLLTAVILAAQCTDVAVNKATPALFARFPGPAQMAAATPEEVEPFVRTLGLFRNKSLALVLTARAIMEHHGGQVPGDRDALQALKGVGRKTASVVLSNAFGIPALAVDTHVGRLSRRLGLTAHEDPVGVEEDLCVLWPQSAWIEAHHAVILHGRRVCNARKPNCAACSLLPHCPQVGL